MVTHIVSVSDIGYKHFIRTGTLDVKSYPRDELPKCNDCIYVAKCKETHAFGPFYVINDVPKQYAFVNTPSIICEARGTISRIEIEPKNATAIQTTVSRHEEKLLDPPSITGNLELDGLLSTAVFDDKLSIFFIPILSANDGLICYFQKLLNQQNIEHYISNNERIFIMTEEVCKKCICLDKMQYYSCASFVRGMMAANIMPRKPLEKILHDSPHEFNTTVTLPDTFVYPRINELEGCGIIVTDLPYGIKRISGLSIRMHPFCHLLNNCNPSEENNKTSKIGMIEYQLGASKIIINNILRLSGYRTNEVGQDTFYVCSKNLKCYVLIVSDFDAINKHQYFFEKHGDDGCVLVLNNDFDCYLKIVKNTDITGIESLDKNIHLFQNLESNDIIPVSATLASELRHKIHLVWDI